MIEKLLDLYKQATTERSHYYTASVIKESIAEISRLTAELAEKTKELKDIKMWENDCLHFAEKQRCSCGLNVGFMLPFGASEKIRHLQTENTALKEELAEKEVYIWQLKGALGYGVPGRIPENPEILNGIADALQKQLADKDSVIKQCGIKYNLTVSALKAALNMKDAELTEKTAECDKWKERVQIRDDHIDALKNQLTKKTAEKINEKELYISTLLQRIRSYEMGSKQIDLVGSYYRDEYVLSLVDERKELEAENTALKAEIKRLKMSLEIMV